MQPASSSPRKTTVLLADDESAVALLFEMDLTRRGYCVFQAHSGSEAVKISVELPTSIDVLVTDWKMPDLRGDDLARRVLLDHPGIKIVVMSGHPEAADVIGSFAMNQALFLRKPFSPAKLVEAIEQLLNVPGQPGKQAA